MQTKNVNEKRTPVLLPWLSSIGGKVDQSPRGGSLAEFEIKCSEDQAVKTYVRIHLSLSQSNLVEIGCRSLTHDYSICLSKCDAESQEGIIEVLRVLGAKFTDTNVNEQPT